jgi:hypothetical protein
MNYSLPFPSFNNDGVYCVSSGLWCRYSGHDGNLPMYGYMQAAGAAQDPHYVYVVSDHYLLGAALGFFSIPIALTLFCYHVFRQKGKSVNSLRSE